MAESNPPYVLQDSSHSAELFRQAITSLLGGGGRVAEGGLEVTPHEPANMSVNVAGGTIEQGGLWIPGTSSPGVQGDYFCWNDGPINLSVPASDPTNPRIDVISAFVQDEAVAGLGNEWKIEVLSGVPTAGANLTNLKGAAEQPASAFALAYVLVPAKATTITAPNILNRHQIMALRSPLVPIISGASAVTAVHGELSILTTLNATLTLPAPTAGALVGIYAAIARGSTGVLAGDPNHVNLQASSGQIFGGRFHGVGSVEVYADQHLVLMGDGSNWRITGGEAYQPFKYYGVTLGSGAWFPNTAWNQPIHGTFVNKTQPITVIEMETTGGENGGAEGFFAEYFCPVPAKTPISLVIPEGCQLRMVFAGETAGIITALR